MPHAARSGRDDRERIGGAQSAEGRGLAGGLDREPARVPARPWCWADAGHERYLLELVRRPWAHPRVRPVTTASAAGLHYH